MTDPSAPQPSQPPTQPKSGTLNLTSGWQPISAPSNRWQRAADRYLAGWEAVAGGYRVLVLIAVVSLLGWLLPDRLAMLPAGVFVLAVGIGCAVGFARCRTAHCAVTGTGLPLVGLLMIAQVLLGASWLGFYTWLIVVGAIILVGFAFQAFYTRARGDSRVQRPRC
ncbi:MAG: hypothetical protein GEV12_13865 [Micromonosporaceae bacterium]|nr:hypothetical protein [Micromonosporaceae bacterium]